jgi:hypothetical protein
MQEPVAASSASSSASSLPPGTTFTVLPDGRIAVLPPSTAPQYVSPHAASAAPPAYPAYPATAAAPPPVTQAPVAVGPVYTSTAKPYPSSVAVPIPPGHAAAHGYNGITITLVVALWIH